MTENDIKISNLERTLDRIVLVQDQTTKNIDSLTNDIKDFGCSKSSCKQLEFRVSKIEAIITRINWIILSPIIVAIVYLVVKK